MLLWDKVIRGFNVSLCFLFGHDWGGEVSTPECPYVPEVKCASHTQHYCSRCGRKDKGYKPGLGWKTCSQKYDTGTCPAEWVGLEREEFVHLAFPPCSLGFWVFVVGSVMWFIFIACVLIGII